MPLALLQLVVEVAALRAVADAHLLAVGAHSAAAIGWQLAHGLAARNRISPKPADTNLGSCPSKCVLQTPVDPVQPGEHEDTVTDAVIHGVEEGAFSLPHAEEEENVFSFPAGFD